MHAGAIMRGIAALLISICAVILTGLVVLVVVSTMLWGLMGVCRKKKNTCSLTFLRKENYDRNRVSPCSNINTCNNWFLSNSIYQINMLQYKKGGDKMITMIIVSLLMLATFIIVGLLCILGSALSMILTALTIVAIFVVLDIVTLKKIFKIKK